MENLRLQEDLLKEFKEEKRLINEHLALLDPLAVSLRKPVVARLWSNVVLLVFEALAWLGIVAVVAFCIIRDKIYPFYILARMRSKSAALGFSNTDMSNLYWSVILFAAIIALLFFIIARNLAQLRKKNAILQMAAKSIKTVVGEQLKRKAAIETLDQRYFTSFVAPFESSLKIPDTEIPNPAL
ncbi:MAG: hypothetical protein QM530_06170 [Phycisphaerales bacterium]|nr:hypothetical protein [Phycisphaerales bacterium]